MAIFKYLTKGALRVVETVRQDGIAASLGTLQLYSQALRKQPAGVALPREIQFEVSNVCNLHCPMCSYASNVTGAQYLVDGGRTAAPAGVAQAAD